MTEIIGEIVYINTQKFYYCAVDNHRTKKGRSYAIIYKAPDEAALSKYMREKGIW